MKIKNFFVPRRTDGEKFLLKMQKQKVIVHSFYIAMGIALLSAFIKLFAFKATPVGILSEELIIFIPLLYLAVSQVRTGLESAKQVKVKEAYPVLLLLALIAGVCSALLSFAGIFVYSRLEQAAFAIGNVAIICAAIGFLTAVLFYLLIYMIIKRSSAGSEQPDKG